MTKELEFHGRVLDAEAARQMLVEGAKVGEADVEVALFGVPDTGKPHGVSERQIIDRGAFEPVIKGRNFAENPVPYYLDHGHAQINGFVDSRLKIGRAENFREEDRALVFRGYWNLEKQVAREAFSDVLFDPTNTPQSFRWGDDKTYRGEDGMTHVSAFEDLMEVSQVGRGAQMSTGVRPGSVAMRSTPVEQLAEWLKEDPSFAKQATDMISAVGGYAADGTQPSPRARAVSADRISAQVRGAWTGGGTVLDVLVEPSLRSGSIVITDESNVVAQYAWTGALAEVETEELDGTEASAEQADPSIRFSDESTPMEEGWVYFRSELLAAILDQKLLTSALRSTPELREVLATAMERAALPDPVAAFYDTLWSTRS